MKKQIQILAIIACSFCLSNTAQAQLKTKSNNKFSVSSSADASMFQLALLDIANSQSLSTLRYSWFWNAGFDLNYKVASKVSIFSGLAVKNLGLIRKDDSSTRKYRTYSLGIPLGLKISTSSKSYLLVGGGVDFPFNYKAKVWVNGRENKVKSNEWFSNEVNPVQPFATLGYRFNKPLQVKFHYYPNNFWNDDVQPNATANLLVMTLGFDINRKKGPRMKELRNMPSVENEDEPTSED